jgi:hypothetical protein
MSESDGVSEMGSEDLVDCGEFLLVGKVGQCGDLLVLLGEEIEVFDFLEIQAECLDKWYCEIKEGFLVQLSLILVLFGLVDFSCCLVKRVH